MDIFLSINNSEQVIQLPIVPREFKIPSPVNHEVHTTINQGEIKLIGRRGLKSVSFDSFFPSQVYSFARANTLMGWEYVEMIESWIDRRIPIRLVITSTPRDTANADGIDESIPGVDVLNMAVTIDNFEYGPQDGTMDVYYTLALSEFKFIKLRTKGVT